MKSIASFRPRGLPAALLVAAAGALATASFAQSPAMPATPATTANQPASKIVGSDQIGNSGFGFQEDGPECQGLCQQG